MEVLVILAVLAFLIWYAFRLSRSYTKRRESKLIASACIRGNWQFFETAVLSQCEAVSPLKRYEKIVRFAINYHFGHSNLYSDSFVESIIHKTLADFGFLSLRVVAHTLICQTLNPQTSKDKKGLYTKT